MVSPEFRPFTVTHAPANFIPVVYNFLYFNRFSKVCQSFLKISCKPPENTRFLITQGEVIGHKVASIEQNLVQELICRFLFDHSWLGFPLQNQRFHLAASARSTLLMRACPPGHCRFLVIVQITNMVSIVRICQSRNNPVGPVEGIRCYLSRRIGKVVWRCIHLGKERNSCIVRHGAIRNPLDACRFLWFIGTQLQESLSGWSG